MKRDMVRSVLLLALLTGLGMSSVVAQSKKEKGPPPPGAAMATPMDSPSGKAPKSNKPAGPEYYITLFIGKPVPEVWKALTDKKFVDQYYMVPLISMEPKVGGKVAYGVGSDEMIKGKVTKWEAPDPAGKKNATLVHTFAFEGSQDPETTVTYELRPVGDAMCTLTILHVGFPSENETFKDITGGWPQVVSSLKTLLETGKQLPWPTPNSKPEGAPAPTPSSEKPPGEKEEAPAKP
ncbi:MAG: SRPBCC domain-containing protein [Candidatus Methylacidiphilales bacterium]|nr:SRPBCC domain-containing protein [Candidatus Methylacidiphilales bacterium]